MPTNTNYRANLWALYSLGAKVIIASTTCRSLQEHVQPGQIVFPDTVFDRTTSRKNTFFHGTLSEVPGVCHIQMHPAYNEKLRQVLISSARELSLDFHDGGFGVCIEGPRFASKAESKVYRAWGASFVDMTMMPECILAQELRIPYATTALVTDFDCWKEGEHVSMELVMKTFAENAEKAKILFVAAVTRIAETNWDQEILDLKNSCPWTPKELYASSVNYNPKKRQTNNIPTLLKKSKKAKKEAKKERKQKEPEESTDEQLMELTENAPVLRTTDNAWKPDRFNPEDLDKEEFRVKILLKNVRSLINKITPTTKVELIEEFLEYNVSSQPDQLPQIVDIIFDQAVEEPKFSQLYSEICRKQVEKEKRQCNSSLFRDALINKAQQIYWSSLQEKQEEIGNETDPKKKLVSELELQEAWRRRKFGNITFIGHLFMQQLINVRIIQWCLCDLIGKPEHLTATDIDEEAIHCGVQLIEIIGKKLEQAKDIGGIECLNGANCLSSILAHLEIIMPNCSDKIRFRIMNLRELRANKWVPRKMQENIKILRDSVMQN